MGRLERGQDPFLAPQSLERLERPLVVYPGVFGTTDLAKPGVLRSDRRVASSPAEIECVSATLLSASCSTKLRVPLQDAGVQPANRAAC